VEGLDGVGKVEAIRCGHRHMFALVK